MSKSCTPGAMASSMLAISPFVDACTPPGQVSEGPCMTGMIKREASSDKCCVHLKLWAHARFCVY